MDFLRKYLMRRYRRVKKLDNNAEKEIHLSDQDDPGLGSFFIIEFILWGTAILVLYIIASFLFSGTEELWKAITWVIFGEED